MRSIVAIACACASAALWCVALGTDGALWIFFSLR